MLRVLAWIWVSLVLIYTLFVGGTYPWLGVAVVKTATEIGFGSLVVGWLSIAILRPWWRADATLTVAVVVALIMGAITTARSPLPGIGLAALTASAANAAVFLLLTRLAAHRDFRPRVTALLVMVASAVTVGYLAQVFVGWVDWWRTTGVLAPPLHPGNPALTFGSLPVLAIVELLLAPFGCAVLWAAGAHGRAVLLAGGALLVILLSGGRGSYLGAAASFATAGGLIAAQSRGRDSRLRERIVAARSLLAAVAGVLVVAGLLVAGPLATRLLNTATVGERVDFWRATVALIQQAPLLGHGPASWPILKFGEAPPDGLNLVVPHAHNSLLQSLSEVGVLGTVAIGVLIVVAGRFLWRSRRSADPQTRLGSQAIVCSFVGFAAASLVDHFLNLTAVVLLVSILAAWAIGGQSGHTGTAVKGSKRGRLGYLVALGAASALMPSVIAADRAAFEAEAGVVALTRANPSEAVLRFREAIRLDPGMPLYRIEAAAAGAFAGELTDARASMTSVAAVDMSPWLLTALARLDLDAGDHEAALERARRAFRTAFGDASVDLNVASIALRAGDRTLAGDASSLAVARHPELAGSDYWTAQGLDLGSIVQAARESLAQASGDRASVDAALIRAYAGDVIGAVEELTGISASPAKARAEAICVSLLGRKGEAIRILEASLARWPYEAATALQLSEYWGQLGDTGAAFRYAEWARLASPTTAAQAVPVGNVVRTASETLDSGLPPSYPSAVYVRADTRLLTGPDYLVIVDH